MAVSSAKEAATGAQYAPSAAPRGSLLITSNLGMFHNPPRHPAVAAATAFGTGIALDRWLALSYEIWIVSAIVFSAAWFVLFHQRWNRAAACLLVFLGVVVGAGRHHMIWSVATGEEISLYANDEPSLVRLTGRIAVEPQVRRLPKDAWRSAWPRPDFSTTLVQCESIATTTGTVPVTGTVQLQVNGHLLHASVGDDVEIVGWISRPNAPRNPGEFDSRSMLRQRGASCVVRTDHPDAVCRVGGNRRLLLTSVVNAIRRDIENLFMQQLSPRTMPLASSLIIGDRTSLTRELRDSFVQSGMMHVLAISGQNVGILAALVLLVCRLFGVADRLTAATVAAVTLGYAALTFAEPPILRATVMILFLVAGRPWHRRATVANLLSLSALILLAWNPGDLFDVGAQLSFLAVMGMAWFASSGFAEHLWRPRPIEFPPDGSGAVMQAARFVGRMAVASYGVTAAVWIFTLPLVAAKFHIVSPVGFVINVLLAPLIVIVLWLGYMFALCGLIFSPLARLLGPAFDLSLDQFLGFVESAADWKLAWFHVPSIPAWWLAGYYALLASVLLATNRRRFIRPALYTLLLWVIAGLGIELLPSRSRELTLRFLAVGHGGAVLVELPNGKTLLYDVGAIHDADYAQHTVEQALWHDHRRGIDALIVSHADVDHFNGAPGLLRSVSVGSLFVARAFLDFDQNLVGMLTETAAVKNVPIRFVGRGDRLRIDDDVRIEVVHPPADRISFDDNANSVSILIEYAGRTILLAGDLAGVGLDDLLTTPRRDVDVLLAPHHGSLTSNTPQFADWSRPELVVVSSGRTTVMPKLRERYAGEVVTTYEAGAVTVTITGDGQIVPQTFRANQSSLD